MPGVGSWEKAVSRQRSAFSLEKMMRQPQNPNHF
jgi:hypothetical protein